MPPSPARCSRSSGETSRKGIPGIPGIWEILGIPTELPKEWWGLWAGHWEFWEFQEFLQSSPKGWAVGILGIPNPRAERRERWDRRGQQEGRDPHGHGDRRGQQEMGTGGDMRTGGDSRRAQVPVSGANPGSIPDLRAREGQRWDPGVGPWVGSRGWIPGFDPREFLGSSLTLSVPCSKSVQSKVDSILVSVPLECRAGNSHFPG